jgi:DNA-binding NarL/FixJ family response regulator
MNDRNPSAGRTAVLLDPHPVWLGAVREVLTRVGVEVVAGASTVPEALAALEEHRPSLFVSALEVDDSPEDGISCVRQAVGMIPELKTVVLTMETDQKHVSAAFEAGAVAYVFKTAEPDDLASAVRQSFEHSVYLAPPVARTDASHHREEHDLTRRELEILRLVADGHSNAAMARMLWVTEQTVKFHLSNIYRKLGVANRTEASRWAQLNGLLAAEQADTSAHAF